VLENVRRRLALSRRELVADVRSHGDLALGEYLREQPSDELGAAAFQCLTEAAYVEHRGERPIAITWRLARAMPAQTFLTASAAAG
jgi:hypothetical protein